MKIRMWETQCQICGWCTAMTQDEFLVLHASAIVDVDLAVHAHCGFHRGVMAWCGERRRDSSFFQFSPLSLLILRKVLCSNGFIHISPKVYIYLVQIILCRTKASWFSISFRTIIPKIHGTCFTLRTNVLKRYTPSYHIFQDQRSTYHVSNIYFAFFYM